VAQINLHEKLQQASKLVNEAQESVLQAQGQNLQVVEQAHHMLEQAENELKSVQNQAGTEATENPQFQQAFEALHDVRQQVQEAMQNMKDIP
jgi:aspartyl/asparaginyl-tRNA synthetase